MHILQLLLHILVDSAYIWLLDCLKNKSDTSPTASSMLQIGFKNTNYKCQYHASGHVLWSSHTLRLRIWSRPRSPVAWCSSYSTVGKNRDENFFGGRMINKEFSLSPPGQALLLIQRSSAA